MSKRAVELQADSPQWSRCMHMGSDTKLDNDMLDKLLNPTIRFGTLLIFCIHQTPRYAAPSSKGCVFCMGSFCTQAHNLKCGLPSGTRQRQHSALHPLTSVVRPPTGRSINWSAQAPSDCTTQTTHASTFARRHFNVGKAPS